MKPQRVPSLVSIAILTTITLVFWILLNVYRVLTAKPSPNVPSEVLEPITPTLDEATISKIEKAVFFQENQIVTPTVSLTPLPVGTRTPVPTPSPSSTSSATPTSTASPTATPGG